MVAVFVSHFLDEYALTPWYRVGGFLDFVATACRIATPTFVLISGIVLGYLYRTSGAHFAATRIHLLDKALFLITGGHLAIAVFTAGRSTFVQAIGHGYVTDTLAFCVLASLLLMPYVPGAMRFWGGVALCALSWIAWELWLPQSAFPAMLAGVALGPPRNEAILFYFPLLPWLGMHLIGGFLGEWLAAYRREDLCTEVASVLVTVGARVVLAVMAVKIAFEVAVVAGWTLKTDYVYAYISPYQKYPPGPTYLLFFGGCALTMIGAVLAGLRVPAIRLAFRPLAMLGRHSLPAFLLQYLVYYGVLHWLDSHTSRVTPVFAAAYLPLSICALFAAIWALDRLGAQRFWTVGLPWVLHTWPWLSRPVSAVFAPTAFSDRRDETT
jgi:uncharacterized membrane protein